MDTNVNWNGVGKPAIEHDSCVRVSNSILVGS